MSTTASRPLPLVSARAPGLIAGWVRRGVGWLRRRICRGGPDALVRFLIEEQRLALEALSGELAHELSPARNFLRFLVERPAGSQGLDDEEVAVGAEEVRRLDRLVRTLRAVRPAPLARETVRLDGVCAQALALLRQLSASPIHGATIDVGPGDVVAGDARALLHMIVHLARHACAEAERSPGGATVGVTARTNADTLEIVVWDEGPPIAPARSIALLDPWESLAAGDLGLIIASRVASSLGFTLVIARRGHRTERRLSLRHAEARSRMPAEGDR